MSASSDPNWTEIAGALAAVFGAGVVSLALCFTAYQIWRQRRDQHEALQVQMAQRALSLMSLLSEIAAVMVRNPRLVPYIYDNAEVPEAGPLRNATLAYARLFMNLGEVVGWQIRVDQMSEDGASSWHRYFSDLRSRSPAVRSVLDTHGPILAGETLWLFGVGPRTEAVKRLGITHADDVASR